MAACADENFHCHLLQCDSNNFGYEFLSRRLGACGLLGVADISQDLAPTYIWAKSDCWFLVLGAERHYYFGGDFHGSWFEEENMRF
jgi:hypothetical protein